MFQNFPTDLVVPAGLGSMLDLSIIIVSYNTKDLLIDCIQSIRKTVKNISYEIIVVDNGSRDGTVAELRNFEFLASRRSGRISNFKLIENKKNLGFAKANNQGMKVARGEFILLLNSDAQVLDEATFRMIEFMKAHVDAAVVGGELINPDGGSQPSTGPFLGLWQTIIWLFGGERLGFLRSSPQKIMSTDWVSGAFFMVRKSVLKTVGLLDEHFFMYMEEMEWCYRMKNKGFSIFFLPNVKALHIGLGSSNRTTAIVNIYKGIIYFYRKHRSPLELEIIKFLLKTKALIAILVGTITQNTYLKDTYRKALALLL